MGSVELLKLVHGEGQRLVRDLVLHLAQRLRVSVLKTPVLTTGLHLVNLVQHLACVFVLVSKGPLPRVVERVLDDLAPRPLPEQKVVDWSDMQNKHHSSVLDATYQRLYCAAPAQDTRGGKETINALVFAAVFFLVIEIRRFAGIEPVVVYPTSRASCSEAGFCIGVVQQVLRT